MRIFCLFAVVISIALAVFPAYAMTDLEYWVEDHNIYCYTTSAKEISGTPKIVVRDTDTHYKYKITENVEYYFSEKNGEITGFSCVCLDEAETAEFLAQCVTGCLSFCGIDNGIKCYDPILYCFITARGGHETDYCFSVPGVAFKVGKAHYGYFFILTKKR